jgi:phospholipid/cholesterol/gamma-HCH transport system substrate-binding protein
MRVSNETKVGVLAALAITLLILGFNFLKGKNLLKGRETVYAVFPKVDGLSTSDAVKINGLQVGTVSEMEEADADVSNVVVGFHLSRDVNIPDDSYATISANPLGSTVVNIVRGVSNSYIKGGDTIRTMKSVGLLDDLKGTLTPAMSKVDGTLQSLDSLVEQAGSVLDPKTKANLQSTLANLSQASHSLNVLLDPKKGALASTLGNVDSFTGNLRKNNDSIDRIIANASALSARLARLELEETVARLQKTLDNLNRTLAKIEKGDGTLGLLVNDPKLYNNLNSTSNSLNVLLQDLRLHPKRYVNVSVFGKKDKEQPLMQPLPDSTTKAPDR